MFLRGAQSWIIMEPKAALEPDSPLLIVIVFLLTGVGTTGVAWTVVRLI